MKKTALLIAAIMLLWRSDIFAQNFAQPKQKSSLASTSDKVVVGETFSYATEWLGLPVGKAVIAVKGIVRINNYDCYHITAEAQPNDFLRRFINLEYKVDTYIDVKLLCSRRFEKIRRMNEATNHVVINFDQEAGRADYSSEGGAEAIALSPEMRALYDSTPPTNKIPYKTQDLVSAFYHFRLLDVKENTVHPVNIYYSGRNWKTSFKVGTPFMRDFRKMGTFNIFGVTVTSELNDFIIGKRGFTVYFSADTSRIPLEFIFNTAVGPIRCIIQELNE